MLAHELLEKYLSQPPVANAVGLAGKLGQIVSGLYKANEQEDEHLFEAHFQALTLLIEDIYSGSYPQMINATLENGLAGLGLALHCLMEDGLIENDRNDGPLEPLLTDIDTFVYNGAKKYFLQGNHALSTGGQGGLYYLSLRQIKNPTAQKYVAELMRKAKK